MKNFTSLFGLVFSILLLMSGCGGSSNNNNNSNPGNDTTPPSIDFEQSSGFTSSDATLFVGSKLKVGVRASGANNKKIVKLTITASNATQPILELANNAAALSYDFETTLPITTGTITYKFLVEDAAGIKVGKNLTINLVDNIAPSITIRDGSASGGILGNEVMVWEGSPVNIFIETAAKDAKTVSSFKVSANGSVVESQTPNSASASYTYQLAAVGNAAFAITADATDSEGKSSQKSVSVKPITATKWSTSSLVEDGNTVSLTDAFKMELKSTANGYEYIVTPSNDYYDVRPSHGLSNVGTVTFNGGVTPTTFTMSDGINSRTVTITKISGTNNISIEWSQSRGPGKPAQVYAMTLQGS